MNVAVVLRVLSTASWFLALAVIVLAIVRAGRNQPFKAAGSLVVGAVVVALLLTVVSAGLVFIQPEERGLHWIIPFAENVISYPISKQTYTMSIAPSEGAIHGDDSIAARTADGQEVLVDASLIYSIDPAQVVRIHIQWQNRYTDDLVRPVARGAIRDAAAQYGIEEIVSSKRSELASGITDQIGAKFTENGLVLLDFVLRNITFSPEYAASVEQKQIAEQQAQQAKFVVEQRKQEAEQARQTAQGQADARVIAAKGDAEARLINAEAEAQALKLIAAALQNNPDLITYQYVMKLAPGIQVMLVPSDNPYLLPLPTLTPGTQP
jgi:regulator of protease activity HflC (stomatin/prohibitin superfamily)